MENRTMAENIRRRLTDDFFNITAYDSVESTNKTAKEKLALGEGSVFVADRQTSGRGRLERKWESEPSVGIYMSALLKPELSAEQLPTVTLAVGLAVCRAFQRLQIKDAMIKWPNDIVLGGRKVCGILCELAGEGMVVAGIGVNVNNESFAAELMEKATSIYLETGEKLDRAVVIAEILNELERLFKVFTEGGFSAIRQDYEDRCATIGNRVRITTPSGEFLAEAVCIGDNGELGIIKDGKMEYIHSGEVSVRGIMGYI